MILIIISRQCLWCCHHGRAIARVHPVYLMNVERRQAAADPRPDHLRGVYSDTTRLNSTQLNCHLSMNVVTKLTQFVGRDVINKNTTDLAVRCSTGSVELS